MKTLFLTGVPGGLATVIRDRFLDEGWSVAGFGRHQDPTAHPAYGFYMMDGTDEASVAEAFSAAESSRGKPDAVIATIGGVRPWKSVAETSVADFRGLFELNLLSFFLAAREAMRRLTDGGRIISIGAGSALQPAPNKGGYIAAKAGVMALTKVLAREGRDRAITANTIVPTVIRTTSNEEWGSPEDVLKWTPPEEIASMCVFLCSDSANSVSGSLIEMPGRM